MNIAGANSRYNAQLSEYLKNPNRLRNKPINLGVPVGVVEKYLGNSQEIFMRAGIIGKALKGHETAISKKDLENLPSKLANPSQVFKSKKEGSIVVAVDIKDNLGQPVVIAIEVKSAIELGSKQYAGNIITSIHGRKMEHLKMWKEHGLELYGRQKEKSSTYLANPGTIPSGKASRGLDNDAKIAQKNENSKSMAQKMAEVTKRNTELLQLKNGNAHKHSKGKHL
jgi:hypothetical protein